MSPAWGDLSDDSTESEKPFRGRVDAKAFSPAIASELRLKSVRRKLLQGAQTHAQASNCLQSANHCSQEQTLGLRTAPPVGLFAEPVGEDIM